MKKQFLFLSAMALTVAPALVGCSDDDDDDSTVATADEDSAMSAYFYSATNSDEDANYLSSVESLTSGTSTIVGNGLETTTGTEWFTYKNKYLFRLQYNQGNEGGTSAYYLDYNGEMQARDVTYSIQRFTTFGIYGDYVITAAAAASSTTDAAGNSAYGITTCYLDPVNQTTTNGDVIICENYLGNGEYVTFSGILESNDKLYTAIIPLGLSAYGVADGDGKWIKSGNEDLVSSNAISGTQYPDECWVAIFDDETFTNPTLISTDQMSYACGRMKSQYYQCIWPDADGNIYVFSPGYARVSTNDDRLKTSYTSRVMRIKAGATEFDSSYGVVDVEALTGGLPIYRCWDMSEDYFLLQLYTNGIIYSGAGATALAVYQGSTKTCKIVSGLPDTSVISAFCKRPYTEDGITYVTVKTTDGANPAVYAIDPATGVATKGLEVECGQISYAGKLTAQAE